MIIILGQGKWGTRLKEEFSPKLKIKTWNHPEDSFEIKEADKIIVAVPGQYLRETLELFDVDENIVVHTATKGLDTKGKLPSDAVKEIWKSRHVSVLGGACISTEKKLDIQYGKQDLEWVGILKNVYAVGYSIEKYTNGDNMAAVYFVNAWEELKRVTLNSRYLADFAVTCFSDKSRNYQAGKLIAQGKKVKFEDGQIAEGIHTAIMLKKYRHYKAQYEGLKEHFVLMSVVDKICEGF